MKVLLLLNSIRISGSEKLMLALSKELSSMGFEFWIYPLITPFDNNFVTSLENNGYRLNILVPGALLRYDSLFWKLNGIATRLFNWNFRSWYMNRFVVKRCREIGIDLIVSNSYTTDLHALEISRKTHIPFVVVEHGAYSSFLVINKSFDPTPIEKSREVIAVSKWSQRLIEARFPGKNVSMIYNAVVPNISVNHRAFDLAPGPFTFCMHGRDTEQKGWEQAIESFLKFRAAGFDGRLVLLCAGPYIESVKARYSARKDIIFGGLVYNIGEVLARVDAGLVLSQHYEAFGLSILDYFNEGKPVIAGNVGAIGEVVEVDDLHGGILVGADGGVPHESEIVNAMKDLVENKEAYAKMASHAKIIAEKFDMKSCAIAYDRLFRSVITK